VVDDTKQRNRIWSKSSVESVHLFAGEAEADGGCWIEPPEDFNFQLRWQASQETK